MDVRETRRRVGSFLRSFLAMDGIAREAASAAGIPASTLDRFIAAGSPKKDPVMSPCLRTESESCIEELLRMGGRISGGGAIARIFGGPPVGDADVFFRDPVDYVAAFFRAWRVPAADVCFYIHEPWDLFDLGLVRCAFGDDGEYVDPLCEDAFRTGVSEVLIDRVVDPSASARRMIKYANRLGIRFRQEQILFLAARGGLSPEDCRLLMVIPT